jgi:hypothetical protein
MTRTTLTRPMLLAAAAFTAAGGYIHLTEWLDTYRDTPSEAPGSWLVRIGFPVNAAVSAVAVVALVLAATRLPKLAVPAVVGTFLFQAGSLAFLIGSRTGTVLGWTEPIWTPGAEQSRAVEIAAMVALVVAAALRRTRGAAASNATRGATPAAAG